MISTNELLNKFDGVKTLGRNKWQAKCPCHRDKKASLTITQTDDKILLHCHAGCESSDILRAVGLSFRDLCQEQTREKEVEPWKKNLEAEYKYFEPFTNKYLYSKLRYKDKKIKYGRTNGKYKSGKGESIKSLYNVNRMIRAIEMGYPIYYAEGEKDADNVTDLGYVCVTSGGVNDWCSEYASLFKGAKLTIFADNDEPGIVHAEKVMRDVLKYVWSVRVIIPCSYDKGDISDVLLQIKDKNERKTAFQKIQEPAEWHYSPWVEMNNSGKCKVNADILATTFVEQNNMMSVNDSQANNDVYYVFSNGVYVQVSKNEIKARITQYLAVGHASQSTINNAVEVACNRARRIGFNELNRNEDIINIRNGLLDLNTMKVSPHNPNIYSTIQLDVNYPPKSKSCNSWHKFINDMCSDDDGIIDEEMKAVLLEYIGLIFSNQYGYRAKKCCILYSPLGNSGKSQLIELIQEIIGHNNAASVSFKDMGVSRWATSKAYGKRLVAVGDQGGNTIDDSSTFKQMTGGDTLSAEFKGKDMFSFKFRGCIFVGTNTLPTFADDKGEHMIERLMILHCRKSIPEQERDRHIKEKMLREKDMIFYECIQALQRLISNGYVFTNCNSSRAVIEEYRMISDTIYNFIKNRCIAANDKKVGTREFHDSYESFCTYFEHRPVNRNKIPRRMESLGFKKVLINGYYYYKGLSLNKS